MVTGRGEVKQAIFRAPFLAPSSEEVSRVNPEEGYSVTQGAAGLHCCFGPVENDRMAQAACVRVRDYSSQCIHTCWFATCPSPQDIDLRVCWGNDLRLTWIKVRGSCADHRSQYLVPVHLSPEARCSQDGWRWVGMQCMASSDLCVSLCPGSTPQCFAGAAFLSVEPLWFRLHSTPDPFFTCLGRQSPV